VFTIYVQVYTTSNLIQITFQAHTKQSEHTQSSPSIHKITILETQNIPLADNENVSQNANPKREQCLPTCQPQTRTMSPKNPTPNANNASQNVKPTPPKIPNHTRPSLAKCQTKRQPISLKTQSQWQRNVNPMVTASTTV